MNVKHHQEGFELLDSFRQIGEAANAVVEDVIYRNNAVGTVIGYYDEPLTILSVSDYLLKELNYTAETFAQFTGGSLRKLFCTEGSSFLDADRFPKISGEGEGRMLTFGGAPVVVHLYKKDSVDAAGTPIWIMSVHVDWENENLSLIMEALQSASWYMDCDTNSSIVHVYWSAAFRKLLGYHDTLDFPNKLESWSDLLHPEDSAPTLARLYGAIKDPTNQTKYDVEYRMRMRDGTYQWFRAIAEITRRRDCSALRISGAFVKHRQEQKECSASRKGGRTAPEECSHGAPCPQRNTNRRPFCHLRFGERPF